MLPTFLFKNDIHVSINGGRDNILENNIMYNATTSAIYVDGRGLRHNRDQYLIKNMNVCCRLIIYTLFQIKSTLPTNKPRCEKTGFLHMRKQRRRSAAQ